MSQLFDDISRSMAEQLPWWKTLGNILGLLAGAAFATAISGRSSDGQEDEKRLASLTRSMSSRADLLRAYVDLAEQEQYASTLTVMLDEQFRSMEASDSSADGRLALLEGERELLVTELPINEKLRRLYESAAGDGQERDNDPLLVRTALLHWMVLLRRRSMQGFHTLVEGLENDSDCQGDIVGDQLFERYFDALFDERYKSDREISVVRVLADLARQSACLGAQQSALLASDLYWSFVELRGFLRLNGLERLVPYVAQAAAAPLLLFYDVEKYRGPQSPLARWFEENYEWLIQGVETKRIPLIWHGLWLYDRRTGRLFGYRPTLQPADENDVNLAAFFASIISRENLGRYDCSFAEMVERGPTSQGYLCAGSICAEAKRSSIGGARPVQPGSTGKLKPSGSLTGQLSKAGFSEDSVKATLCNEPSSAGRGDGGGGRVCGDGITGLGRGWSADTVRCVSQQVMQPGQRLMRCVAETMGLCSNPIDKATKELQQAMFAGIKVGSKCQTAAGMGEVKQAENLKDKEEKLAIWEQIWRDTAANIQETEKKLAEAKQTAKWFEKLSSLPVVGEQLAEQYKDEAAEAAKQVKDLERLLAEEKKLHEQADKERKNAKEEVEKAKPPEQSKGKDQQRCPPDTPNCGGNDCSAMSSAVMQVMQCFEHEALEEELEMLRHQPGFVDAPLADPPPHPLWSKCFDTFDEISTLNKECWAYDCGSQTVTGFTEQGKCGCGPEVEAQPGAKLNGMCNHMRCSEGMPTVRNGKCVCDGGGSGGTFGGPNPVPVGPFITSSPRLFSEVRLGNMPQVDAGTLRALTFRS